MHDIEPFFHWREKYKAEEDKLSPFYNRTYSEIYFTDAIYNYVIHPQWDNVGSSTLFIKILFTDYEQGYTIIELLGEWNDAINNDIMTLKRNIIDVLIDNGISKFILVGDSILNFHSSDDSYYEEWFQDCEEGWIVFLNFRDHVLTEMQQSNLDYYVLFGGEFDEFNWKQYSPTILFHKIDNMVSNMLR